MVTGGLCGARPPSRSVVRVAPARRCGFVGAGPAAAALTVSPFLLWVGAPPRPWGGGGPRLWLPSWGGCGGGGGGTPLALGPVWEGGGGGEWGGSFGSPATPPVGQKGGGGGGGGLAVPAPGASHRPGGSRPSPAPLYRVPDPHAVPPWGPSSPGRCRAALAGRGWP